MLLSVGLFQLPDVHAQDVQHWRTVIFDNDTWKYQVPTAEPASDWRSPAFDDSNWQAGPGGFGYGDSDDNTILPNVQSVFTRIRFTLQDTSALSSALLHVDYDDAFVAFLNNVEIARAGIGNPGDRPAFNQAASSLHEAEMYAGRAPSSFLISPVKLSDALQNGENVLAIQVHNDNPGSSDLTLRTFFSVAFKQPSSEFRSPPAWFTIPKSQPDELKSTLPIVIISTEGQTIPDEPKIIARMGIIDNSRNNPPSDSNSVSDAFNHYNGFVGIERRGASSQSFAKLSYAVETRDAQFEDMDVSLLGMPEEEDWVLNGPYSDKSLMRNVLVFNIANKLGRYAPKTRFVELILNNEYQGIYVMMEKIKRDKHRVDIAKLNPDENTGDDLTGGYIVKVDKSSGAEVNGWYSPYAPKLNSAHRIFYQFHYPKPSAITEAQQQYIEQYITDFEDMMAGPDFADPNTGYPSRIDVDSAIDFFLMNELARNVDGYRLSTYLYKDKDSKDDRLIFGPLWDFNFSLGNADYYSAGLIAGFQTISGVPESDSFQLPFWWKRLFQEPAFNDRVIQRWDSLRQGVLHTDSLMQLVDEQVALLGNAPDRNFARWQVLGTYLWPNFFVGNTYEQEINFMKEWIQKRVQWIDANLATVTDIPPPGGRASSFAATSVYPNPAHAEINLTVSTDIQQTIQIELYDPLGRRVALLFEGLMTASTEQNLSLNLPSLAGGVYMLRIVGKRGTLNQKLIIR